MNNIKTLVLMGALALAAPVAAVAAPAGGLTAHGYNDLVSPVRPSDADVAQSNAAPKVDKVWYRGGWRRGYGGWRGYGFRGPFIGFRGPYIGFRGPYYGGGYWRARRWGY